MIEGYVLKNKTQGFCLIHNKPWIIYSKDGRFVYECTQCREEGLLGKNTNTIELAEEEAVTSYCCICGIELVVGKPSLTQPYICSECRNAVEWAKKKMKQEDDRR